MLAFLPPEAQDLLLDNVTALSATGSRLAAEIFVNAPDADNGQSANLLDAATQRWRAHGLDMADNGLPALPPTDGQPSFANNYYCTATL